MSIHSYLKRLRPLLLEWPYASLRTEEQPAHSLFLVVVYITPRSPPVGLITRCEVIHNELPKTPSIQQRLSSSSDSKHEFQRDAENGVNKNVRSRFEL
jgi:hypothetical protein